MAAPLPVERLRRGGRVLPESGEGGESGADRALPEPLGVLHGGAGVGEDGGNVERSLRQGARGVGEGSPGPVVVQPGAPAGGAPRATGVERQAERLVPALLVPRGEDEPDAAAAAAPVGIDVVGLRGPEGEELPGGIARDRAGRDRGRPGADGPWGARPGRGAAERGFHPARRTTRPAPFRERAAVGDRGRGRLQTGAGTRSGGVGPGPAFFFPKAVAGAGSEDAEACALAFVACGTVLPEILSMRT